MPTPQFSDFQISFFFGCQIIRDDPAAGRAADSALVQNLRLAYWAIAIYGKFALLAQHAAFLGVRAQLANHPHLRAACHCPAEPASGEAAAARDRIVSQFSPDVHLVLLGPSHCNHREDSEAELLIAVGTSTVASIESDALVRLRRFAPHHQNTNSLFHLRKRDPGLRRCGHRDDTHEQSSTQEFSHRKPLCWGQCVGAS